ncbi:MAG: hypothetical protein DMG41_19380 [Acidobacteria bacterium]|nr:MAG: hypothetical protein AUH13_10765 [Acidobacteria bacterium 13_2_20CM_58_27]PYT66058.1 MAG: hypothetical protein DMG42_30470 [Acidobacteriota bacterium]PYT86492.1 MAG: hypothetical protein DMG41_19380 [Acidobacteriota bacterium]
MKSLFVSAFLLLGTVCASQAQVGTTKPLSNTDNPGPDFSATSAGKVTLPDSPAAADSFAEPRANSSFSAPRLGTALLAEPAPATPAAPSPNPRFVYGGRDDFRWQLSVAFAWFRFRSSLFNSSEFGVKTTLTYFLNEWLGVEGSFTGAFGGDVAGVNGPRIAVYGGGPKVAWRQKRWEPWLHAIFGGAREGPQVVSGSRNSLAMQFGGGADYRWNPHVSFRAEGDYVHTGFFAQTQSNFQLAGGVVIHF